jgi:hypothetical protein
MHHLFNGRTLNFAHRGASLLAPENTLAAFELAVKQGRMALSWMCGCAAPASGWSFTMSA